MSADGEPAHRARCPCRVEPGDCARRHERRRPPRARALLLTVAGRVTPTGGRLRVAGHLLPERGAWVRAHVGVALLHGSRRSAPRAAARPARTHVAPRDRRDRCDPRRRRARPRRRDAAGRGIRHRPRVGGRPRRRAGVLRRGRPRERAACSISPALPLSLPPRCPHDQRRNPPHHRTRPLTAARHVAHAHRRAAAARRHRRHPRRRRCTTRPSGSTASTRRS